ncbi:MAG: phage tail protein [Vicinamibacterales bacterium]
MADDGSAQSTSVWPLPKFRFQVKWDGHVMEFQEVSGLSTGTDPIQYRGGNSPTFSTIKMPGLRKGSNVTLKKGIVKDAAALFDWLQQVKMNTAKRTPVTISLLDESGASTMVWTLESAWPMKYTSVDLKATGNDVAIETIEIACDGITIGNG